MLFRPAVRYVARFPAQRVVPEVDALIEEHGLLTRILRQRSGDDETAKIGELGEAIRGCKDYSEIPEADRPGAGRRAVAGRRRRGAVDRRRRPVPALADRQSDGRAPAHQRQPAPLPAPARRLQHEEQAADPAAVAHRAGGEVHPVPHGGRPSSRTWTRSPPCRIARRRICWRRSPRASTPSRRPTGRKVTNLGQMRAVPEVKDTVNLAQQYVNLRYDPKVLMKRLAEIVCHDSFTEMHAFKHHQAVIEEFHATREPWRWMHLVCRLPGRGGLVRQEHGGLRGRAGADARRVVDNANREARRLPVLPSGVGLREWVRRGVAICRYVVWWRNSGPDADRQPANNSQRRWMASRNLPISAD